MTRRCACPAGRCTSGERPGQDEVRGRARRSGAAAPEGSATGRAGRRARPASHSRPACHAERGTSPLGGNTSTGRLHRVRHSSAAARCRGAAADRVEGRGRPRDRGLLRPPRAAVLRRLQHARQRLGHRGRAPGDLAGLGQAHRPGAGGRHRQPAGVPGADRGEPGTGPAGEHQPPPRDVHRPLAAGAAGHADARRGHLRAGRACGGRLAAGAAQRVAVDGPARRPGDADAAGAGGVRAARGLRLRRTPRSPRSWAAARRRCASSPTAPANTCRPAARATRPTAGCSSRSPSGSSPPRSAATWRP